MVSTEPSLWDFLPQFVFACLSFYPFYVLFHTILNEYLCRLKQSATDHFRKYAFTCPMETIVSCQRTYPDAYAELKLLCLLSSSLAKSASKARSQKTLAKDPKSVNVKMPAANNERVSKAFEWAVKKYHLIQLELRMSCAIVASTFSACLTCIFCIVYLAPHWHVDSIFAVAVLLMVVNACLPPTCTACKLRTLDRQHK